MSIRRFVLGLSGAICLFVLLTTGLSVPTVPVYHVDGVTSFTHSGDCALGAGSGTTMEDAICSLPSGGSGTFYADNCGEVFSDYLMLLVPNTYVQVRGDQCGNTTTPYYTTVQQPILNMGGFIGAGRGAVGPTYGGSAIVACLGGTSCGTGVNFPAPIPDPTAQVTFGTAVAGACTYTGVYIRYANMAPDGALTSAPNAIENNTTVTSGNCAQAKLPATPTGTATGNVSVTHGSTTVTWCSGTHFLPGPSWNLAPIMIGPVQMTIDSYVAGSKGVLTEKSLTLTTSWTGTGVSCAGGGATYYGPNAAIYACDASSGSCAGNETFLEYAALTNATTTWNIPNPSAANGFPTTNATGAVFLMTAPAPATTSPQFGEQLLYWSIDCNGAAANAVVNRMSQETSDLGWINAKNCPGLLTATAPYIIAGNNGASGANNMGTHDLTTDMANLSTCASEFGGSQGYPCNPGSGLASSVLASGTVMLTAGSPYTGTLSFTTGAIGNLTAGFPIMFYALSGDTGPGDLSFIINAINPGGSFCTSPCLTLGTSTTATQAVPTNGGGSYHWAYTGFSGAGFYDAVTSSSRGLNGMSITPNSGPTQFGVEIQSHVVGTSVPNSATEFTVKNIHCEGGQSGVTNNSFAFQFCIDAHGPGGGSVENVNTSSTTRVAAVHLANDAGVLAQNWTLTDIAPYPAAGIGPPPLEDDVDSSCPGFPALGTGILASGSALGFASIGPAPCQYYFPGLVLPTGSIPQTTYWCNGANQNGAGAVLAHNNTEYVWPEIIPVLVKAGHLVIYVTTAETTGNGNNYSFGLFDSSGALIAHTVAAPLSTLNANTLAFAEGTVTLQGLYAFGETTSATCGTGSACTGKLEFGQSILGAFVSPTSAGATSSAAQPSSITFPTIAWTAGTPPVVCLAP